MSSVAPRRNSEMRSRARSSSYRHGTVSAIVNGVRPADGWQFGRAALAQE